jgi:hypothetical protein
VVAQEDDLDEDADDKANAVYISRYEFDAVKEQWRDMEVPVFCSCNLPYNPDLDMVQCLNCNEWFASSPYLLCNLSCLYWRAMRGRSVSAVNAVVIVVVITITSAWFQKAPWNESREKDQREFWLYIAGTTQNAWICLMKR